MREQRPGKTRRVRRHRSLPNSQGLRREGECSVEFAQAGEAAGERRQDFRDGDVVTAQSPAVNRKGPLEQRKGLAVKSLLGERLAEHSQCARDEGMVATKRVLPDRDGTPVQRSRSRKVP